MYARLRQLLEVLVLFVTLTLMGVICLLWTVVALPLFWLLPRRQAQRCGRRGIRVGFSLFFRVSHLLGAIRFDLSELRALRDGPPVVLAPNHPGLLDAVLIIAHEPRVACVLKSALMNNAFLGAGARLARYIRCDPPRRMIRESVSELRQGGIVLLFPEGTRTAQAPINELQAGVGIIAKEAGAPVQTVIIETDSLFGSKGRSLFRPIRMPIRYRMRLGRRFDPPADVREFVVVLDQYFRAELADAPQNHWMATRLRSGSSCAPESSPRNDRAAEPATLARLGRR